MKKTKGEYYPIPHLLHCSAAGDLAMFKFLVEHTGVDPTLPLTSEVKKVVILIRIYLFLFLNLPLFFFKQQQQQQQK